jgi:hypothetical protein
LENNGYVLSRLYEIAASSSEYLSIRSTISNLNKKIKQHDKILTVKRVEEVYSFYDNLIDEGFEFKDKNQIIFEDNLNVNNIYIEVFKDQNYFLNNLYNFIFLDEVKFNENEKLYKTVKEIIDNYYISYGLSLKELVFLNNIIKILNQ